MVDQVKRRWWVRVFAYKADGLLDRWPDGVQAWQTGFDPDDRTVWCLLIDAPTHEDVHQLLDRCWSTYAICFVIEKALNWTPGSRFPEAKL